MHCFRKLDLAFDRQLAQVEDFLTKNGVKTLRKLKAVKFEDLIFGNSTPQGVKIFLRQAFEAIEEEKGNGTLKLR